MNMHDALFWLYLVNSVVLINHEIESAYWREWELFRIPGGITGFLLIHFPVLFVMFYGLASLKERETTGLVISLLVSLGGLFAFCAHSWFIRQGRTEFTLPISRLILAVTLALSVAQGALTLYLLLMGG
ncbi:MAG: hypothetical protein MUC76_00180 [Spirochaetes bacterium]|jgi:hypothetical protein|nr:hypothetical protein [Spirochaetota bacterium]